MQIKMFYENHNLASVTVKSFNNGWNIEGNASFGIGNPIIGIEKTHRYVKFFVNAENPDQVGGIQYPKATKVMSRVLF